MKPITRRSRSFPPVTGLRQAALAFAPYLYVRRHKLLAPFVRSFIRIRASQVVAIKRSRRKSNHMNPSQMPLNQPVVITNNSYIHVVATRTTQDDVQVIYKHPLTSDVVLDLRLRADGNGTRVEFFDKAFWSITINGRAATEGDIEDLTRKSGLIFKMEPETRSMQVTFA